MNSYDRVGEIIFRLVSKRNKIYNRLSIDKKKKILLIYFDDFVSNTNKNLLKINKFLKRKQTNFTKKTLIIENCPRKIFTKNYEKKKFF